MHRHSAALALSVLLTSVSASNRWAYNLEYDSSKQALLQPGFPGRDALPVATPISWPTAVSNALNSVITAAPELDRRQQDPSKPFLCNDGICGSTQYCTVFQTRGPAVGVCCGIGLTCTPQLDCVPHNPSSDPGSRTAPVIFNDIVTCDQRRPYCIAIDVVYGYGTDLLHVTNCFSENIGTTTTTNSWWYSKFILNVETTTTSSSSSSTIDDPTTTSTQPPETSTDVPLPDPPADENKLSTGAIAGIAVGAVAIVCIAACILAFIFFRRRKAARAEDAAPPSYFPPPTQQQYYAPAKPEQPMYGSAPGAPGSPPMNTPTVYSPYNQPGGTSPNTMVPTEATSPDNRGSIMSELPGSAPYSGYRT